MARDDALPIVRERVRIARQLLTSARSDAAMTERRRELFGEALSALSALSEELEHGEGPA